MAITNSKGQLFLVVDHVKQSRDTLRIFSYSAGAKRVDSSFHAKEIMNMCENNTYDVILLGYDLGDNRKNGQQLLEELRVKNKISRHCIIIMITGELSQAMVLAAIEHKPDDYLAKPFTLKDINTRLNKCSAKKAVMTDIYAALDEYDPHNVINLCQNAIDNHSPYSKECLGIQSRQYFELAQYEQAEIIYNLYKSESNCQWATIGLGKIALVNKDFIAAKELFQSVIDTYPTYLSAYDWLADTYEAQNRPLKAEEVLEEALLISPLSVPRLKRFAHICLTNKNYDKATKAYYKTTELAYHSIHRQPDNAINFAKALLEYTKTISEFEARQLNNKAFKALNTMTSDFHDPQLKITSLLLSAQLHNNVNEAYIAKEQVRDAKKIIVKQADHLTSKYSVTIAKSLHELDEKALSHQILQTLAHSAPDDIEIQSVVAGITNANITEENKIHAQNALTIAIKLYNSAHYRLAIDKLNQALNLFPMHVGIKLNLFQAIIAAIESDEVRKEDIEKLQVLIEEFRGVKKSSLSYQRYDKLYQRYLRLIK